MADYTLTFLSSNAQDFIEDSQCARDITVRGLFLSSNAQDFIEESSTDMSSSTSDIPEQ